MEKAVYLLLLMLLACNICWSVQLKCPEPCDCQHLHHILCSNKGLLAVPKLSPIASPSGTKTYSLGGNFISNISSLDFLNFPHLQRLDLQYNRIHFIHPKAFEKLGHLEELYLGNNLLPVVAPGALSPLKKLKVLNVNSNRLNNVSKASFSSLTSLIKLRLDNNEIQNLHGSPFSALSNLLYLHLENNKITNISKNAFAGLGKLRLLSLSGNPQRSLRHSTFLPLRSLSTLTMAGNHLQQLGPGMFHGLQRLSRLILSSNQLSLLHNKTFQGLGALQELHLNGNLLKQLPEGLLLPLHNLEVLNLSHNALSNLHPGAFHGVSRLRVLDLQHNMLSFLPDQMFSGNPALYRLQLDGNRWNCDCHLLGLKHWIQRILYPRSRMLTVFVQCWEPQEVAGKYLDYLEDSYLQGEGGCILNTTPAAQEQGAISTLRHKDLVIHHAAKDRKDEPSVKMIEQIMTRAPKKQELLLPLSTLSSQSSSDSGTFELRQQADTTKKTQSIIRETTNKHQRQGTVPREKGSDSADTLHRVQMLTQSVKPGETKSELAKPSQLNPESEKLHPKFSVPVTQTLRPLHSKHSGILPSTSKNLHPSVPETDTLHHPDPLEPPSGSAHAKFLGTVKPPHEIMYDDARKSEFTRLHQDDTAGKGDSPDIPEAGTLHHRHPDTMQPSPNSFQDQETELLDPVAETLHQIAPLPSLLSDPCEFNKMYLLNLSVESVGSSTARIRWQVLTSHTRGPVLFRVLYERFGQTGRYQRFVYPRGPAESLTLQELTGDTPYLVCVESIIGGRACPVAPRDHCVGLVTLPSKEDLPLLNYQFLALALLALNAVLLLFGLVIWGTKAARKKWGRRRTPVHVRQMYSTRRPYRSVGTGVSTDFSGFQSHRPRTAVCALGEADLIEFPGCDRFREGINIHREDLLQRFSD
ncbi:TLR4 interactor with leucine rich repeats [Spea bombifrons]|uniref:TLR4 interactor with leucine rich repeats n=1 Tax=Spea bombifrons TaxID=233779 RepID=UPI00234B6076|nr:TLR4 interactor with leucine rich repeats [Spea bombifrons]